MKQLFRAPANGNGRLFAPKGRRTATAILLAAACLLCACSGSPAPSGGASAALPPASASFAGPPLLADFCAALEDTENLPVIALSPQEGPAQRVSIDEALLADVADAFYEGYEAAPSASAAASTAAAAFAVPAMPVSGSTDTGSAENAGSPAASASISASVSVPVPPPPSQARQPEMIEFSSRAGTGFHASFYPAGASCDFILVMGEETLEISFPNAVYRQIAQRIQQNLAPDELVLRGPVLEISAPRVPQGADTPPQDAMAEWMDCAGGLAALYTWTPDETSNQRASALEILNPETGERLFYQEIGAEALYMEAASFLGNDLRVVMADGAMWYLNSQDPAVGNYYFYLPAALRERLLAPIPTDRPTIRHFDGGTGQGAVWAVTDEEGLHWARRSAGGTIESAIIEENLPANRRGSALPPQFGEVRVMNGGATLAATVVLPDSQIGDAGIFTYQIASGEMNWYFGMFVLPLAQLHFVDDQNLLVAGLDEFFRLNVATGESSASPAPAGMMSAFTADYKSFVFTTSTPNPDGANSMAFSTTPGAMGAEGNAGSTNDGENAGSAGSRSGSGSGGAGTDEEPTQPFLIATSGAQFPVLCKGITNGYLIVQDNNTGRWYLVKRPEEAL